MTEGDGVETWISRKLNRRLYASQLKYCQLQGRNAYNGRPVSAPSRIALNTYAGSNPSQFYKEVRRRTRDYIVRQEVEYVEKAKTSFKDKREKEISTFSSPLKALSFLERKGSSGLSIKQLIDKIARHRARSQIAFEIEKRKLEFLDPKEIIALVEKDYRQELASKLIKSYTQGISYEEKEDSKQDTPAMAWTQNVAEPKAVERQEKNLEFDRNDSVKAKRKKPTIPPGRRCLWLDGVRGRDLATLRRSQISENYWDDSYSKLSHQNAQSLYLGICNNVGTRPLSLVLSQLPGKAIEMKYYSLSSRDVQALSEFLAVHDGLESFTMAKCRVQTEDACLIMDALSNKKLSHLNLSGNKFTHKLCQHFKPSSPLMNSLKSLDLSGNNIHDRGLALLFQSLLQSVNHLEELKLSNVQMSLSGAKHLKALLHDCVYLKQLDLSLNSLTEKGAILVAEGLKECPKLQSLTMARTGISEKGIAAIASACCEIDLHVLDLSGCNFQSIACLHLSSLIMHTEQRSAGRKEGRKEGRSSFFARLSGTPKNRGSLELVLNSTILSGVGGECLLREAKRAQSVVLVMENSRLLTLEKTSNFVINLSDKAGRLAVKALLNHEEDCVQKHGKPTALKAISSDKGGAAQAAGGVGVGGGGGGQDGEQTKLKDVLSKMLDAANGDGEGDAKNMVRLEVDVLGELDVFLRRKILGAQQRPQSVK